MVRSRRRSRLMGSPHTRQQTQNNSLPLSSTLTLICPKISHKCAFPAEKAGWACLQKYWRSWLVSDFGRLCLSIWWLLIILEGIMIECIRFLSLKRSKSRGSKGGIRWNCSRQNNRKPTPCKRFATASAASTLPKTSWALRPHIHKAKPAQNSTPNSKKEWKRMQALRQLGFRRVIRIRWT